jgi:Tol biopolymer transport system component
VSPDGQWLAFVSTRHANEPDVYLKRLGSAREVRLTDTPKLAEITPRFNARGDRLAFAGNREGQWDLFALDLRRSHTPQPITATPDYHEIAPDWHPQRPEVVACCARTTGSDAATADWQIVIVNTGNNGYTKLLPGLYPRWSPDGGHLLFQQAREREPRLFSIWRVAVAIDARGEVRIGRPTEVVGSGEWAAINPDYSPDGKRIVFATVARSAVARRQPQRLRRGDDLWTVKIDGTDMRRLTTHAAPDYDPAWSVWPGSPDGRIFFVSQRSGQNNIWSVLPQSAPVSGASAP